MKTLNNMTKTEMVEKVLSLYPETNTCPIKLLARTWEKYYGLDYDKILLAMAELNPNTLDRVRRKLNEVQTEGV